MDIIRNFKTLTLGCWNSSQQNCVSNRFIHKQGTVTELLLANKYMSLCKLRAKISIKICGSWLCCRFEDLWKCEYWHLNTSSSECCHPYQSSEKIFIIKVWIIQKTPVFVVSAFIFITYTCMWTDTKTHFWFCLQWDTTLENSMRERLVRNDWWCSSGSLSCRITGRFLSSNHWLILPNKCLKSYAILFEKLYT